MSDRTGPRRRKPPTRPPGARILFHPNASTPQARINPENRRWEFLAALDRLTDDFKAGEIGYHVVANLYDAANRYMPDGQPEAIEELRALAAMHPISTFIRQCPWTRRAQERPTGNASDPGLIDFIYRHPDTRATVTGAGGVGQSILLHNLDTPLSGAVRARRNMIASRIAMVAGTIDAARILSVGCGHARELEIVPEPALTKIGAFIGVDNSPASLQVASQNRIGDGTLTPVLATRPDFIPSADLTGFDLIYVASLYEQLNERACRRLTKDLMRRLHPGGRLLIGNIMPGHPNYAYMELFMHWSLIHRDRAQINYFARGIAESDIARQDVFMEPNRCIGFLELVRA